jgi:hypothetical protein
VDGGLAGEEDHFMGHTFRRSLVRQALQAGLTLGQIAGQMLPNNVDSGLSFSQGTAPMLRLMGKLVRIRAWTERETAAEASMAKGRTQKRRSTDNGAGGEGRGGRTNGWLPSDRKRQGG